MNNKIKVALVAAAALFTASAVYAAPHHWNNWGNPDCPYVNANVDPDFGPNCPRGFDPRGPGFGPGHGPMAHHPGARWGGPGMGRGMGAGLETPYMENLVEQAGLKQDYQHVLRLKDELFAKRQVLTAIMNNSDQAAEIEKAANDFTQARRTFRDASEVLFDKLSAKYPQGLPTPQSQAAMPK